MTTIEDRMRKALDDTLEVYYVKDEQKNRERESDKSETINWIISEIMKGPEPAGIQGSDGNNPRFTWTFGYDIWEGEKKCIIIRDPICRICNKNPSVEVHHIRPKHLKGNPTHPRNLIGLCLDCHDEVHRRIDKGISKVIEESIGFVPVQTHTLDRFNNLFVPPTIDRMNER